MFTDPSCLACHRQALQYLETNDRYDPLYATQYWRNANHFSGMESPFSSQPDHSLFALPQTSSETAKHIFRNIRCTEELQRQSLLSSFSKITEIMKLFVSNKTCNNSRRTTLLPR